MSGTFAVGTVFASSVVAMDVVAGTTSSPTVETLGDVTASAANKNGCSEPRLLLNFLVVPRGMSVFSVAWHWMRVAGMVEFVFVVGFMVSLSSSFRVASSWISTTLRSSPLLFVSNLVDGFRVGVVLLLLLVVVLVVLVSFAVVVDVVVGMSHMDGACGGGDNDTRWVVVLVPGCFLVMVGRFDDGTNDGGDFLFLVRVVGFAAVAVASEDDVVGDSL